MNIRSRHASAWLLVLALLLVGGHARESRADAAAWESATRTARTAFERGRYAEAGEAFARAAEVAAGFPADDWRLAGSLQGEAESLIAQSLNNDAERLLAAANERWRVAFGERSAPLAMAMLARARLETASGRVAEAGQTLSDAVRMLEALEAVDELYRARLQLAAWQRQTARYDDAGQTLASLGEAASPALTGALQRELAALAWARGEEQQALTSYERAATTLADDDDGVAVRVEWGEALRSSGQVDAAAQVLERARSQVESRRGAEHPSSLPVLLGLVEVYAAQGRYAEADALGRRALELAQNTLGETHPGVAQARLVLGDLERSRGRLAGAATAYAAALEIQEKMLGADHPRVARVLERLAQTNLAAGRAAAAEPQWRRAQSIYERSLGETHPSLVPVLEGLAELERERGGYGQAERLLARALELDADNRIALAATQLRLARLRAEAADGEGARTARADARRTLATLPPRGARVGIETALAAELVAVGELDTAAGLLDSVDAALAGGDGLAPAMLAEVQGVRGDLLRARGEFEAAGSRLRRTLSGLERALGFEHPALVPAVERLARLEQARGRHADAETLLRRVLGLREKLLGDEHPLVAETLRALAVEQAALGRYADARAQARRALTIDQAAGDSRREAQARDRLLLATLAREAGAYAEAEQMLAELATPGSEELLGAVESERAALAWLRGQDDEALLLYGSAAARLVGDERVVGVQVARARALRMAGRLDEAARLLEQAREQAETRRGAGHPSTLPVQLALVDVYAAQEHFDEADALARAALESGEKVLGKTHPEVGEAWLVLGDLERARARLPEALAAYAAALEVQEKALGFEHPRVARVLERLAETNLAAGGGSQADTQWRRALSIYERSLGEAHPSVARVLEGLGELERERGRYAEAERLLSRALAIRSEVHGAQHLRTASTMAARAAVQVSAGNYEQAEQAYRDALTVLERDLPPKDARLALALRNLAALSVLQGRLDEAHALVERAEAASVD